MLTISGTHDVTPFGEFMISPIHCKCRNVNTEFVSLQTVYGLMTLVCLPRLVPCFGLILFVISSTPDFCQ